VRDIFTILRRINREDAVSILLVEQNAELALDLASEVYLFETGRVVMSGAVAELRADAGIRRADLGY
jgi:branched-chain amino acid transport system ATP-binding protein